MKIGNTVRVYWNLKKHNYSVQQKKGSTWLVQNHVNFLVLKDAKFLVSTIGEKRVQESGHRNVCAKVEGTVEGKVLRGIYRSNKEKIRYTPYDGKGFRSRRKTKIKSSKVLVLKIVPNSEGTPHPYMYREVWSKW